MGDVCYAAGWDYVCTGLGEHDSLPCRVCGGPMAVTRDVPVATGWSHAMAIHAGEMAPVRRDVFHCPHSAAGWHVQALALRQEAHQTASRRLADLLTAEADAVVRTRTATRR